MEEFDVPLSKEDQTLVNAMLENESALDRKNKLLDRIEYSRTLMAKIKEEIEYLKHNV